MTNELKPCPFCDGVAEIDTYRYYRNISTGAHERAISIYCTNCDAEMMHCLADTPEYSDEDIEARLRESWNTRVTPN